MQEAIVNNLALKWEDAEEAKLKAGQEEMQDRNPEPVKPSTTGRLGNLFWKSKPNVPAQPVDTCADLLQIPKACTYVHPSLSDCWIRCPDPSDGCRPS